MKILDHAYYFILSTAVGPQIHLIASLNFLPLPDIVGQLRVAALQKFIPAFLEVFQTSVSRKRSLQFTDLKLIKLTELLVFITVLSLDCRNLP